MVNEVIANGRVRLSHLHLAGTEFRLADPRNLYAGNDRASFVFASLLTEPRECAAGT
jgi:hypothetical protein